MVPRALLVLLGVTFVGLAAACGGSGGEQDAAPAEAAAPQGDPGLGSVTLLNEGGELEGHTPRGFAGSGTGLFAGDNLNPGFPNGDGVQIFLTFPLEPLGGREVGRATLTADGVDVAGTPFEDLGDLSAEQVRFTEFGPALWEKEPVAGGSRCVLATSADGPFRCDVTAAVREATQGGEEFVQFRVRFERAGDGDGQPDLAMFFLTDSNTNEPGIFAITVDPSSTGS
ncbi:MAG: hypothetical protein ACE5EV_01435 [Gaiellales bacterium]